MKKISYAALLLLVPALSACSDNEEGNGGGENLNPEPTQLTNLTLVKASFAEDEFNMVSEPGFELFPDEDIDYRSLWYFEGAFKNPKQASKHTQAHGGSVALRLDNPNEGSWCDACLQSIALKKGKDYTFSCFGQASWADMNVFTGVRLEGGPINDAQAGDWTCSVAHGATPAFGLPSMTSNSFLQAPHRLRPSRHRAWPLAQCRTHRSKT